MQLEWKRGEPTEKAILRGRFERIRANWNQLMDYTRRLTFASAGYGQFAIIFPFLVSAPRYFGGTLTLGGMMQVATAFGQVQGAMSWFVDNYGTLVDVVTALSIRFTNGACGTFAATSLSQENWREEFSFYGSEGVLNIRDGHLTLHKKGQDTRILRGSGRESRPVANFMQVIAGEALEPQAGPIYGLRVAQISEAAYKSSRSGLAERVG
jgi:predicted dehydrogenase